MSVGSAPIAIDHEGGANHVGGIYRVSGGVAECFEIRTAPQDRPEYCWLCNVVGLITRTAGKLPFLTRDPVEHRVNVSQRVADGSIDIIVVRRCWCDVLVGIRHQRNQFGRGGIKPAWGNDVARELRSAGRNAL